MSKPKLVQVVRDEDWGSLCILLRDRRTTLDSGQAWLKKRGYNVSRKAVWTLRQHLLRAGAVLTVETPGRGESERQVKFYAARLSERGVAILALFAAFLAGEHGGRLEGIQLDADQITSKRRAALRGGW